MSTLYFLRQPFVNDPKDTWRTASGRAFDLMPEADRMAVVPAASLADAQAEIARLRGALEVLETGAHFIFNNPPGETSQDVRDVIEWFAGSIRVALEQAK